MTSGYPFERLGTFLGSGGFGYVFKSSDNYSAIKLTFPDIPKNINSTIGPEQKASLEREYKYTKDKPHDNIVKIFDFRESTLTQKEVEDLLPRVPLDKINHSLNLAQWKAKCVNLIEVIVIEMELCGPTLREWLQIQMQTMDNKELQNVQVGIVKGLVSGLQFLHTHDIIHRDLKPENIMFSYSDGNEFLLPIKIGDLGLCRQLHSEETLMLSGSLTSHRGTKPYRAPETDGKDYSFKADLYSMGLIMWEVLQITPTGSCGSWTSMFDRLVIGKEFELVKTHAIILNSKEIIIGLTERKAESRLDHIPEFRYNDEVLRRWKLIILCCVFCCVGVVLQIFTSTSTNPNQQTEHCLTTSESTSEWYTTTQSNLTRVTNSEQLRECLNNGTSQIQLVSSVFEIDFEIVLKSGSILRGVGPDCTVIKSSRLCKKCDGFTDFNCDDDDRCEYHNYGMTIGDNCTIGGFKIILNKADRMSVIGIGSGNIAHDIELKDGSTIIGGSDNNLSTFVVKDSLFGIKFEGHRNKLRNARIENAFRFGVQVIGNENQLNGLFFKGLGIGGQLIHGDRNQVRNVKLETWYFSTRRTVEIVGRGNVVDNFQCERSPDDKGPNGGMNLKLTSRTSDSTISNTVCTSLFLDGTGHNLINVNATEGIVLKGSGHNIQNCSAPTWINKGSNVTIDGVLQDSVS